MKIENAKLTILINQEFTEISIEDGNASTTFVKVRLTPEQLSKCLSRLSSVNVDCDVYGIDKLGKTHENKYFEFEIPEKLASSTFNMPLTNIAHEELEKADMSDWKPDSYYSSQNSFFKKDGKQFARVTIRRWV